MYIAILFNLIFLCTQFESELWESLKNKQISLLNRQIERKEDIQPTLANLAAMYGTDSVMLVLNEALYEQMNTSLDNTNKGAQILLEFSRQQKDTVYMIRAYLLQVGTLTEIGQNQEALDLSYQALDLATLFGSAELEAQLENNIAALHQNMGDFDKAIVSYSRFIDQVRKLNDQEEVAKGFLNLATPYMAKESYDTAEIYLNQALILARNLSLQIIEAYSLGNLAYIYVQRGEPEKAIQYQTQGLEMERTMNDNLAMIDSHGVLSSCYLEIGNMEKALFHFEQALVLAQLINAKIKLLDVLDIGQQIFASSGSYKKAYDLAQQYQGLNDSLRSVQKNKQFAELREKYETAQKETKIISLEEQKRISDLEIEKQEQENLILIIAAILSLFISSLVLFFLIQIRKGKKEVEQRNLMITNINKALNKSQDALIASNKTKDKFFALIAHDLRGPVTSMQGIGRMLAYYNKKGDENRINELISQVDQSAQSVNHLLDNLLKWALAQTDGLNYQPTVYPIGRLIDECTLIFDENLRAKQIVLKCEIDREVEVNADYNMISTVLRNLLSNAIKFSPEGTEILLTANEVNGELKLSVKDAGKGVPAEIIEKLKNNQTLSSTRGTHNEKGTGLGLTLCREFILRHHANLNIDSSPDGTTISFGLPIVHKMANA